MNGTTYEIRLGGLLDEHWSTWFDGLTLAHRDDGTTVISGPVADQAELHGLLARIRDLGVPLLSVREAVPPPDVPARLSRRRLLAMRSGFLLMAVGLALVKWPLLPDAADLPLYEGVTLCLLTAMSLLALVGLRHPVRLLPVLVFESAWKLLWLALVALPRALSGDLDPATTEVLVSCSLVVLILAVTPWRFAWRAYGPASRKRAA